MVCCFLWTGISFFTDRKFPVYYFLDIQKEKDVYFVAVRDTVRVELSFIVHSGAAAER